MRDVTLEHFLSAVAEPTPTPGGGSVSALAGALSVALSRMVAGLARGKTGYEAAQVDLEQIEARAAPIQARLEALVEEDAAAYELVLRAMRMPKATPGEKKARVEALQAAFREATKVPLETMERGAEALELARAALDSGNRSATTDAGVAILLAEAAVHGASLNCRVNLASIRDETFRGAAEARLGEILQRADRLAREALALVETRI